MNAAKSNLRTLAGMGFALATAFGLALPSASRAKDSSGNGAESLVGQPAPPLAFRSYTSRQPVDLNDLRGKMVVVDFFQADGEADKALDAVIQVEHDYGPKGVVILGVGMDENNSAMNTLLRKKQVDWPIDYNGLGFASTTAITWKTSVKTGDLSYKTYKHIDFVVAPNGTILWVGLPADLGGAIADQIKDHKPVLVDPREMADAKSALDKVVAAITANKVGEAYRDRAKIPNAALVDDDFAAQVKDADDKLKTAGDAALAEVDPLIASKDYAGAVGKLKDLADGAEGTPLGTQAKQKLATLQKDPDARAALQAANKNALADSALKAAQKLQANKQDVQAYARFKYIVKTFAASPAAQTATDAIAAYDADPQFKKKLAASASGSPPEVAPSTAPASDAKPGAARAKGLLSVADSYRDSGNTDKARSKYQEVIAQFPGTPEADTAKDELAKLPQ